MAKDKNKTTTKEAPEDTGPAGPPRLKTRFEEEVRPKIASDMGVANHMAQPVLDKIVINVNVGKQLENNKLPTSVKESVLDTLTTISGQRPVVKYAKKSVSNFKVREGAETAMMVTLRKDRMWHFLDRLINLGIPRIKDFRGVSTTSFDPQGNYSMGLNEQGVFPEIDMGNVGFTHGMNINLVFRNSNPDLSRFVLTELGMPFRKED
ncbi:MAG: 50S ribosomal protein L5 [Phycisphaerales bacterium]